MRRLWVRNVRTGLSWADSFREGALDCFDRQMAALAEFEVTVTFCFTPEHRGLEPHHTSPPQVAEEYADQRFVSQADAESWVGETWTELADEGVASVTLFEGERAVYGPMSLSAG